MCKGRVHAESVDQAAANVHRLGHKQKLLLKTDGEPALVDLRRGVSAKLGLQTGVSLWLSQEMRENDPGLPSK